MQQRKSLPKFRFSVRLIRALKCSPEHFIRIGPRVGFSQPQISRFCARHPFTSALLPRVHALAEHVGVPADRATVRVS